MTKICLAGLSCLPKDIVKLARQVPFVLESYYYFKPWEEELIYLADLFVSDSGAFSYMAGSNCEDIAGFTRNYAKFVKKYKIKNYMEMDLDRLIGVEKTFDLRKRLEDYVGYASIPVFHKERGIDAWYQMCEDYDYVAIGTIGDYLSAPRVLKNLVHIANQHNTKVHLLGYTRKDVAEMGCYSVDSSSWSTGQRYATLYQFDGKNLLSRHSDCVLENYVKLAGHNLLEWVKYAKYVERTTNDKSIIV